jgi:hypothetical protein
VKRTLRKSCSSKTEKTYSLSFSSKTDKIKELQKMMETINLEGKKDINKTQKNSYKIIYKELVPILRLFNFLKNNNKLRNESVLNQFKLIFRHYKESDKKLQEKFNDPEDKSFNMKNRVSLYS